MHKPIQPLFHFVTFCAESLKTDKDSAAEKAEFLENQLEKANREIDHIKEKMRLEAKEYDLKIQMLDYEHQKVVQQLSKANDGKCILISLIQLYSM